MRAASASLVLVAAAATSCSSTMRACRWLRPVGIRAPTCTMMAKKFKGGNLDDFLSAGEAEAKFGPQRYASVYDDLRTLEVKQEQTSKEREYSKRVYEALKGQLLFDHAFLSACGIAITWSFCGLRSVQSYVVGALLGGFYLYLSQRSADSFGAQSVDDVKGGPPSLIVPVIMVLLIAKNPEQLNFLPVFAGFLTERISTVVQAVYPSDFGIAEAQATDSS